MWTRRTKYADFVTNVVILHEEFVSPHYVVVEIPCDSFIQKLGSLSKEWRNYAWRKVCSYARLQRCQTLVTRERGTHLVVAQLSILLVFPQD